MLTDGLTPGMLDTSDIEGNGFTHRPLILGVRCCARHAVSRKMALFESDTGIERQTRVGQWGKQAGREHGNALRGTT